ncbi:MAG: hypothetical protein ACLQDL_09835 [Spirochaetia bacterium]
MQDRQLLRGIPVIRRARGFRLYDTQGRRYLDLFRDGALMGHRGEGSLTAMKSALSQGLAAGLPSIWEKRLLSTLTRLFSRYPVVRLYASPDRALEAASRFLGVHPAPRDPALGEGSAGDSLAAFWRPFLPFPDGVRVLLPLLPIHVCGAPAPACFAGDAPPAVPLSDAIPAFILAGAIRGCAALLRCDEGACPLSNPAVEKALDAAPGWARVGPYIRAVFPADTYAKVHAEFLREGVLLHPWYPGPSVLPGECSPGETRLLADLFSGLPGG